MLLFKSILVASPISIFPAALLGFQTGDWSEAFALAATQAPHLFLLTVVVFLFLRSIQRSRVDSETRLEETNARLGALADRNVEAMLASRQSSESRLRELADRHAKTADAATSALVNSSATIASAVVKMEAQHAAMVEHLRNKA